MQRPNKFLAIGGPLNKQMITTIESVEWGYIQFNRSQGGIKAPSCVFIWPTVWN